MQVIAIPFRQIYFYLENYIKDFGLEEAVVYLIQQRQILDILNAYVDNNTTKTELDRQFQYNFEELIRNDVFVEIDEEMFDYISYACSVISDYLVRYILAYGLIGRISAIEVTNDIQAILVIGFDSVAELPMDYGLFYQLARGKSDIYGNPLILSADFDHAMSASRI